MLLARLYAFLQARPRPDECPHCGRPGSDLEETYEGGWKCPSCGKVVGKH